MSTFPYRVADEVAYLDRLARTGFARKELGIAGPRGKAVETT